jgi:hypothetical protein
MAARIAIARHHLAGNAGIDGGAAGNTLIVGTEKLGERICDAWRW